MVGTEGRWERDDVILQLRSRGRMQRGLGGLSSWGKNMATDAEACSWEDSPFWAG